MSVLKRVKMVTKTPWKGSFEYHCAIGAVVRIILSIYSLIHDQYFRVRYTDVDYKVYTLAAKEVISQRSPYEQQAFRYSPIVAYLSTPNVLLVPIAGKIIASAFDVGVAYLIYKIVLLTYRNQKKALQCAQLWLYNPLPIIICTRGSIDSLSSFFVLLTLYYQLKENYVASGALLGLSVHLRLYPIVFLPSFLITAGRLHAGHTLKLTYKAKLTLLVAFVASLAALTGMFYYVYGQKFVDASVLYHVYRQDVRHNFSLYFYVQYLGAFVPDYISKNLVTLDPKLTKNLLLIAPNVILQLVVAFKYNSLNHLPFSMFCSAFIFVVFNRVLTSQYFIWYLALLPLFLPSIILSAKKVLAIVSAWSAALGLWLVAAYLLEFQGHDTFLYIHLGTLLFCAVNVAIVGIFVNHYNERCVKKID